MIKKPHGMTGKRNALKSEEDKIKSGMLTTGVPLHWLAALRDHCPPRKVSESVKRWIVEGARKEGLDL